MTTIIIVTIAFFAIAAYCIWDELRKIAASLAKIAGKP